MENEVTANNMAEEVQVQQETQQVTVKDPKKVEVGKRLAAHNHRKRELKVQKGEVEPMLTCGIGTVLAVRVIGGLDYYIY